MINAEDELSKEILNAALERDLPGAKLKHEPIFKPLTGPGNAGGSKQPPTMLEIVAVLREQINQDLDAVVTAIKNLKDRL